MGRQIWKYPIPVGTWTQPLPLSSRFLKVDVQHGNPQMWWMVDPNAVSEYARFAVVGTGHHLPDESDKWEYLGTFMELEDQFVGHLFRIPNG